MTHINHGERDGGIKPCPVCTKPMTLRKTSAVVDGGYRKWFFFMYCSQCGYGPNSAFDTINQAVDHWNETTLTMMPPVVMAKDNNNFNPRLFN